MLAVGCRGFLLKAKGVVRAYFEDGQALPSEKGEDVCRNVRKAVLDLFKLVVRLYRAKHPDHKPTAKKVGCILAHPHLVNLWRHYVGEVILHNHSVLAYALVACPFL